MNCPNCQTKNRISAFFCKDCGAALSCPRCREALPDQAEYCDNCGQRIAIAVASESTHSVRERPAQRDQSETGISPEPVPPLDLNAQPSNEEITKGNRSGGVRQ